MSEKKIKEKKVPFYRRISVISIALAVIFIIGFSKGLIASKNEEAVRVTLDAGPCITFSINGRGEVLKAMPENDSAKEILGIADLAKPSLSYAVTAVANAMAEQGILQDGAILLSADGKIKAKNERTMADMEKYITTVVTEKGISCPIHMQDITNRDESVRNFAKEHGISDGKAFYILEIAKTNGNYVPDDCVSMTVKDLFALPKQ